MTQIIVSKLRTLLQTCGSLDTAMIAVNVLARILTEVTLQKQENSIFFANSEFFMVQERVSNTSNRLREISDK